MSITDRARDELNRINFGPEDTEIMLSILKTFFDRWDSGASVEAAAPVLQRLIAGKCLSPLTGEDDEWFDPDGGEFLQNRRCGTVFKSKATGFATDLDNPCGALRPITFPYLPAALASDDLTVAGANSEER
jgi:hypothetical protein